MDQYILIWQMYIFEHFDSYTHIYIYAYIHIWIHDPVFFNPTRLQVWRIRHCWAASGRHRQTKINSGNVKTECLSVAQDTMGTKLSIQSSETWRQIPVEVEKNPWQTEGFFCQFFFARIYMNPACEVVKYRLPRMWFHAVGTTGIYAY